VHLHILLVPYRSWQESEVQLVQSFHQLNHRYSQNTCLLPEKRLAANFIINITYAYREDYEISRYLKKTSGHHLRNLRLQKRLNILYPSQHFWLKKKQQTRRTVWHELQDLYLGLFCFSHFQFF